MRIQSKVFVTILVSSSLLVAVMSGLALWSLNAGLVDHVNEKQRAQFEPLARTLEERYQADGWQSLRQDPRALRRLVLDTLEQEPRRRPPRPNGPESHRPPPRAPTPEVSLLDKDGQVIAGRPLFEPNARRMKLRVQGRVIGYLVLPDTNPLTDSFSVQFATRQETALLAIAGLVLVFSATVALLLAPRLVRPIRQIADAASAMSQGRYDMRLPQDRHDELGELGRDMNHLAHTLRKSETQRQRWLADTSHELRTPLAIIKGEIEAMLDGVRPLNAASLTSLKQEADHLHRLINDLADLSNADIGSLRYQKQDFDFNDLLARNAEHLKLLAEDAGLVLTLEPSHSPSIIHGDEKRLQQLLDNLVTNSCKYTDAGGLLHIYLQPAADDPGIIELIVEDSAPGVPQVHLPHLFDYLYRIDSSRNRATGGAGLGLAIVERIVAAHDGEVTARASTLGGLAIVVRLPRA